MVYIPVVNPVGKKNRRNRIPKIQKTKRNILLKILIKSKIITVIFSTEQKKNNNSHKDYVKAELKERLIDVYFLTKHARSITL